MSDDKNNEQGSATSMDQVRDLLFGAHLKDINENLNRQKARTDQEIDELKSNFMGRLETLENFMKSENDSLVSKVGLMLKGYKDELEKFRGEASDAQSDGASRCVEMVNAERQERTSAVKTLAKEIINLNEKTDSNIGRVAQNLEAVEKEIRSLMLRENALLDDKINDKFKNMLDILRKTEAEIRKDMVGRTSLGLLLTNVAMSLSNHPEDIDKEQ